MFSQQLLVTYLHLSMFRNVSYLLTIPLLKNAESFRRLVTKQLISYLRVPPAVGKARSVCFLEIKEQKQKYGDKAGKQHIVIQGEINRKRGPGHSAVSWKD